MKKIAFVATVAAFALTACGETTDASEEAQADTVEVEADAAMEDMPEPVADDAATAEDLTEAEAEAEINVSEEQANRDADNAQATVDDALAAAEAAAAELEAAEAE